MRRSGEDTSLVVIKMQEVYVCVVLAYLNMMIRIANNSVSFKRAFW